MKITGRSSSITNAFVNSIIPVVDPSPEEIEKALDLLGMTPDTMECAYCGDRNTEWDHFRPLVADKKPTGYISEIRNLVPSCGKCNQSKGNKKWKAWIRGPAPLSPATRGVTDLAVRVQRLQAYENWPSTSQIDFELVVDAETWESHWVNCEQIQDLMKVSQVLASKISEQASRSL